MLSKILQRAAFTTFNPTPKGGFNLLGSINRFKNTLKAPIKHIKRNLEPTGVNYQTMTNTTEEAFDEVSHEWQTLITHNPFDVQVFNYLEGAQAQNFGTVDNPYVVFTADMPFRYVGCTGQMNEDDYEGHELMFFMLREGPLQRCPLCGQVFKLVRLRNEYSPEMDYYLSSHHTYDMQEMGENDTTITMSIFKYASHHEYSQFEVPSNMVYSMVNPDEHDRMLVDPAYRLERTKALEEKLRVYLFSLIEVDKKFVQNFGPIQKIPFSKVDFTTLIDVEKAIAKLERQFRKVAKFHNRKMVDPQNHERREKRMLDRKSDRWDANYTFFFNGLSEEEQQYKDYFKTDIENYPEDEVIEQKLDEQNILQMPEYRLDRYDFQEGYTRNPEDDQSSLIEQKAFSFKYRLAKDPLDVYVKRQKRLVERQQKRFANSKYSEYLKSYADALNTNEKGVALAKEKLLLDFIVQDSIQQIKDYYEDDKSFNATLFNNLSASEKVHLAAVFENHTLPLNDQGGFVTIPKRQWDYSFGLWTNFILDFSDFTSDLIPKAQQLANNAKVVQGLPLTKEELAEAGLTIDGPK